MLTEHTIREMPPGPKIKTAWDKAVTGFGIRVYPTGRKSFVLRRKGEDGKVSMKTLGESPALSLKDARELAARLVAGMDTVTPADKPATVADAAERFIGPFMDSRIRIGRNTERTRRDYGYQLRGYILPAIGHKPIASVTRADIERMVEPMPGPTRNRVLALASRLMNLAERWELRPQSSNPCKGVERAVERARERVLSDSELRAIADGLAAREGRNMAAVAAIWVAAYSGLRISEVLAMRWEDMDGDSGAVTLPETKTGARVHHLADAALAVISRLPRLANNPHVFASRNGAAIGYRFTRKVFMEICDGAGVADCRLHDLRRSIVTRAAAAGMTALQLRDTWGWSSMAMPARYVRLGDELSRSNRREAGDRIAAIMGS